MSIHQPNLLNHQNPILHSHQHLSSHLPHDLHRSSQTIPTHAGQIPSRPINTSSKLSSSQFAPPASIPLPLNSLSDSFCNPLTQISSRNQHQLASNFSNAPIHTVDRYLPPDSAASFTRPSFGTSFNQLAVSTQLASSSSHPPLYTSQAPVFDIDSFYPPLVSQSLAPTLRSFTEPAPPLSQAQVASFPLPIASLPQDPPGPSCFPFPPPAPLELSSEPSPHIQDTYPRQAALLTSAPAPAPSESSGAEYAPRVSLDRPGVIPPPVPPGRVAPTEQPSSAWPPLPGGPPGSPVDLREPRSARPRSPQAGDRSPRAQVSPPRVRTLQTAPAQDFKRRKEWPQRLVGDVGDVLALVGTDGQLLFASESIGRVTGFGAGALLGTAVYDLCFAEEDRTNLQREVGLCASSGRDMNVYCRFRRSGQEGMFVILEMLGRLIRLRPDDGQVVRDGICINARPYPTSCGELMDEFLELMLENEAMEQILAEARSGDKRPAPGALPDAPEERADEPEGRGVPEDDPGWASPTDGGGGGPRKRAKRDKADFLCLECGVTDSPEWRKGPRGRKTLCNACGLRYAKKTK